MNSKQQKAKTCLQQLRLIGLLEGISFLLLLGIAMPLKYYADFPAAVKITGWIHGLLFILFVIAVVRAASILQWHPVKALAAFLASILPFGTFVLDKRLQKEEQVLLEVPA